MRSRPLKFESLECRRVMAIVVSPVSEITIDEGETVRVASDFFDSSPGGSYQTSVQWGANTAAGVARLDGTPSGNNGALQIRFDYRYDNDEFFSSSRRQVLNVAAELVMGQFSDALSAIRPSGRNAYTASFLNPSTGQETTLNNLTVNANEIVIFVGSQDLPGNDLARGGAGGGSASGSTSFVNNALTRGQQNAPDTDYGPWGGAISFDKQTNWHSDLSADGLKNNQSDLLSVAMHELGHVLGFTSSVDSFRRFVFDGTFRGPAARAAYDGSGNPPLADDDSHWKEDIQDGGQEVAMDPTISRGQRKLFSDLDFAAFQDVGWEVNNRNIYGELTASTRFTDDGIIENRLIVTNANETGQAGFTVTVRNVAPSLAVSGSRFARAGDPFYFSALFADPGSDDTHQASITWGDGTAESTLAVSQPTRELSGDHVYAQPGTYTATVQIEDDDGGQSEQQYTIEVVDSSGSRTWHNSANPLDVNNSGTIEPLDVNVIVTELTNVPNSDPVSGFLRPPPSGQHPYIDTNNDGYAAPIDALIVINHLNGNNSRSDAPASIVPTETTRSDLGSRASQASVDSASKDSASEPDPRQHATTIASSAAPIASPVQFVRQSAARWRAALDAVDDVFSTGDALTWEVGDRLPFFRNLQ